MLLTSTKAWKALQHYADTHKFLTLHDFNPEVRKQVFTTTACSIHLDYSNQRVTNDTLHLLFELAHARNLPKKINALFQGENVNLSESRPALHSALRAPADTPIYVNQQDIMPDVIKARQTIRHISEQVRSQQWLGFTGEPIKDVVNIGIGGSDLGPRFCVNALTDYISANLNLHFISDAEPSNFQLTMNKLKPETTLFIICSKSFSTQETLYNAEKAIAWLGNKQYMTQHMIAVTANREKALEYGIKTIVPIWQ